MSPTAKSKVLIADEMSPRAGELLRQSAHIEVDDKSGVSAADLLKIIGNYEGVLVRSRSKITAECIEAGKKLRIIGRAGIGVDNIDVKAASRRGIIVENAPSGNSVTTAEHALCLLLSLARHIPQATASMKAGAWEKTKFSGAELLGKTLGIIGLGNIGRIVADRARGLKLRVIGADPFIGKEAAARIGVELVSVDELIKTADFITVHTPLTAETKGLLGAAAFQKVKPGVLIVNCARGGIVDEEALIQALNEGKVGGAALDVFSQEPTPKDSPLVAHPKVICTPHLGASTDEAQEKVAIEVAEQLTAFFEKGEVRNAVNVQALSAEIKTRLSPWLDLCQKLGALIGQLAASDKSQGIDSLSVEVTGEAAEPGARPCTSAALVGLLQRFLDVPVNEVNASIIASDRGLEVKEVVLSRDRDHNSAIALTAKVGGRERFVKGTLYHVGDRVEPRLVQLDDFLVEATPSGRLVVVINKNRPGVIGAVGTLLGKRGINVQSLHVGVGKSPGVALMLWNIDQALDSAQLAELKNLDLVDSVQVVEL
jgi:D-3-phosphoglycerate dehydrogenase